jgi:hypothetical protein
MSGDPAKPGGNGDTERRSALEDSFFSRPRAELRERLRAAERARTQQMEGLAEVSGIGDPDVLERLTLLDIRGETLAALTLYPLVAVAWADGSVDRYERETVLRGARECGIHPDSVSYELLADWLEHPPDDLLLAAWKAYVAELSTKVSDSFRDTFEHEILARARAVANASGGFLALDKTSGSEQKVLDTLTSAFR